MAKNSNIDIASTPRLFKPGTLTDLALIILFWALAVVIVNPIGDFPLNDDWSMGKTVEHFMTTSGDYRPIGWMSMTLISQVLWGTLFCLPHGFSFTALRFSTLTLSLVGIVVLYLILRQLHKDRHVAVLGTILLAFNPLYFALSNSFMTDVPFTAMAAATVLVFIRQFQTESLAMLLLATVFAIICTLCRQLGLAIPFAFTLTLILKYGLQRRNLIRALTPSIAVFASWALFNHWLEASGRKGAAYDLVMDHLLNILHHPITVPLHLVHHGWNAVMYLGCFLLPLLAMTRPKRTPNRAAPPVKWALGLFAVITIARFIFMPQLMPVHNNVLDPRGIGPLTLRDIQLLALPHIQPLPKSFWLVVTVLTLIGAWILIHRCTAAITALFSPAEQASENITKQNPAWWQRLLPNLQSGLNHPTEGLARTLAIFFLLSLLIYMSPIAVGGFFDRYLIPALFFLVVLLSLTSQESLDLLPKWRKTAAIVYLAALACYAVTGTRDYLTWNRVRWTALADLQKANIPPEKIDGGFEFNGWYFYNPNYKIKDGKSDWWVVDNEYLLSFGELVGFDIFKEYTYSRWLPPSRGHIFVLKRKYSMQPGPIRNNQTISNPATGASGSESHSTSTGFSNSDNATSASSNR